MNRSHVRPRAVAFLRAPLAALAFAAAPLAAQASASPPAVTRAALEGERIAVARHVVVISIDGLRPDAIERAGAATLGRLMREGAWAPRARTILPSLTLPSHTSMLTGVGPDAHGITWNSNRSRRTGPVRVPTLFDVAEAAGLSTAAVFGKSKFRHLVRPGTPHWRMAPSGNDIWYADQVSRDAERLLVRHRPDLLFVHLADPDLSGHLYGWMSAPYRVSVRRADRAVERVVRAAERAYGRDVVVIVTADHGGARRGHGGDTSEERAIPWIAWGRGVVSGQVAGEVETFDTAATALWLLGLPVPADWAGRPVASAFTLPPRGLRLHPPAPRPRGDGAVEDPVVRGESPDETTLSRDFRERVDAFDDTDRGTDRPNQQRNVILKAPAPKPRRRSCLRRLKDLWPGIARTSAMPRHRL